MIDLASIKKKSFYAEVGGYDEDLSYGEFQDIRKKTDTSGMDNIKLENFYDSQRFRRSFREVYGQGKWYGKTFMDFLKKYPEEFPSLLTVFFFFSIPFVFAAMIIFNPLKYILALQFLGILYISLESYRLSGSPYGFLVPLVKFVRSMAMAPEIIKYIVKDLMKKVRGKVL